MPISVFHSRFNQRNLKYRNKFGKNKSFKTDVRPENQNGAQSGIYRDYYKGSKRPLHRPDYDKILALHLNYSVTEEDLKELFTEFGFRNVMINHDANGNPRGTALIEFSRPDGAMAAITRFNNVAFEGIKMRLERVISESDKLSAKNRNPQNRKSSGNRVIPHNQSKKRKNNPRQRRRVFPGKMSIEELDAQLEAYKKAADARSS